MTLAATIDLRGRAMELLVRAVANSSGFQDRCRLSSPTTTEGRIHWPWLETDIDTVENSRPAAIIEAGEYTWDMIASGDKHHLRPQGAFDLTLTDNDRHIGDYKSSAMDFMNFVDEVLRDLEDIAGKDDNIAIVAMQETQMPMRSHPTQDAAQRGYWSSKYRIAWSVVGFAGGGA